MKIKTDDDKIVLENEDEGMFCVVMEKPEIDDYSNMTERPLVVNYHQEEETVWLRSCRFVKELRSVCEESPYFICYLLLLGKLSSILSASSQTKNIICYGMDEENKVIEAFQSYVTFIREKNSFVMLPSRPSVFSVLLNASCHAAIVCIDACEDLRIVCDAISKIRKDGMLILYTQKGDLPPTLSGLLCHAEKKVFGSSAVYSIAIDADISTFAGENNSEASMVPSINVLLEKFGELGELVPLLKEDSPDGYLYAAELLWQIERGLLDLYDALENPELPILANRMKEAAMDCYIGISAGTDVRRYFYRVQQESRFFDEAMQAEFG